MDPDGRRIEVFFAEYAYETVILEILRECESAIVLIPTEGQWNDFGLRTVFEMGMVGKTFKEIDRAKLFLGFLDEENSSADLVSNRLREIKRSWCSAEEFPAMFTMLPNMQAYRSVVGFHGIETATAILSSLNDLVALGQKKQKPEWYEKACSSHAFTLSFMRNSDSFFAFQNAYSILDGLDKENLDGISDRFLLNFKLRLFENEHRFEFRRSL